MPTLNQVGPKPGAAFLAWHRIEGSNFNRTPGSYLIGDNIPQGPKVEARQRRSLLTVDGNSHQACCFGKFSRPSGAARISQGFAFFNPAYPSAVSFRMELSEDGNDTGVEAALVQSDDGRPSLDPCAQ